MSVSSHAAITYIAQYLARQASSEASDANSSQTSTIAAPGSGKSIVIGSISAWYSDASSHDVTITYTDRDDTEQTVTLNTGGSTAESAQAFPPSGEAAITTAENTKVTVDAPASGAAGETSHINVVYSIIDTPVVDAVMDSVEGVL